MDEEKHRMLYQGQDPSQPVLRHLTLSSQIRGEDSDETPKTVSQLPPTYEDVTVIKGSLLSTHRPHVSSDMSCTLAQLKTDRRCTFSAKLMPNQHNYLEQPDAVDVEPTQLMPDNNFNAVVDNQVPPFDGEIVEVQPLRQSSILPENDFFPQVRSFFTLAPQPKLGAKSCAIVCPACGQQGLTRLQRTPNTRSHLWALWLCSVGWCCCACLYPYLINSCRTTSHYCSKCKTFLGAYYSKNSCH
ncbi:hypothetical protein ACLKA6_008561 [Drosophila palustris]